MLHFVADAPAALRPSGVLVCVQAEIADAHDDASRVRPCYLSMRILGRMVTRQGEPAAQLRKMGWRQVEPYQLCEYPMAPVQLLIARKAS